MITNQMCDSCAFQSKCVAVKKLKPFTEDARVDLGVELDFVSCVDYREFEEDEEVDEPEGEDEETED